MDIKRDLSTQLEMGVVFIYFQTKVRSLLFFKDLHLKYIFNKNKSEDLNKIIRKININLLFIGRLAIY